MSLYEKWKVTLLSVSNTNMPNFERESKNILYKPQKAIILAAGVGLRMAPINMTIPKGLLEVNGQPLIERLIIQLHEAGVHDIYVVVGYKREEFEYLRIKYNVSLIINEYYHSKNNLYSLNLAGNYLEDSYIIPCDIWCKTNPFNSTEPYTWYMVTEEYDSKSSVKLEQSMELTESIGGNRMVGIAYIASSDSENVKKRIQDLCKEQYNDDAFWEIILSEKEKFRFYGKLIAQDKVTEINTYEQLRKLDSQSIHLDCDEIALAANVLNVSQSRITDISSLKKGMTNRSFVFSCEGNKYIMRIPGEGTEKLINRQEEATVYQLIAPQNICDPLVYINPQNGYKITKYVDNARVCDPFSKNDVVICIDALKRFHKLSLKVSHTFDLFDKIEFYENLWQEADSAYADYEETKKHIYSLQAFIDKTKGEYVLTHIDAVPDNFLICEKKDGEKEIKIIDWEYAAMQDPHVDIAMFCIYALYDRQKIDETINIYFNNNCPKIIRTKIYCYIAVCGLLWSNWCEYKRQLGVEFGEYALKQYLYAKEYFEIVKNEIRL